MRVCALDIETTGLDHSKDYVTEIGWVIKDIGDPKPLAMESKFCQLPDGIELTPEIKSLTKITEAHCIWGWEFGEILRHLDLQTQAYGVKCVVAHNGQNFDKPFLQAKASSNYEGKLFDLPWLDTSVDCVYPPDCRHTNLMYVAAYYGFLNPFPHAALFDAMTTLKVLEKFDIKQVFERAQKPWVVIRALVDYERRQLAKERRFCWEALGDRIYPKQWVKRIKECDLEKEKQAAPFEIVKVI